MITSRTTGIPITNKRYLDEHHTCIFNPQADAAIAQGIMASHNEIPVGKRGRGRQDLLWTY